MRSPARALLAYSLSGLLVALGVTGCQQTEDPRSSTLSILNDKYCGLFDREWLSRALGGEPTAALLDGVVPGREGPGTTTCYVYTRDPQGESTQRVQFSARRFDGDDERRHSLKHEERLFKLADKRAREDDNNSECVELTTELSIVGPGHACDDLRQVEARVTFPDMFMYVVLPYVDGLKRPDIGMAQLLLEQAHTALAED